MKNLLETVVKTMIITVITVLFSTSVFSQTSGFGIAINGLTTNYHYGKSNDDLKAYKKDFKGFQAGILYQAKVNASFSVVPELYFAIKGGILKSGNPLTLNKTTLRISSLEMPVLARVHFGKFYLNAGPYAAINLGGLIKTEGSEPAAETRTRVSFGGAPDQFKRWDYGAQGGAGYNFNMKKSTLTLDVRYGYGLANLSNTVKRYSRMLNISVRLTKPVKKSPIYKQG